MIRQNGISDRNVAGDTFIETPVGEDPESARQMLLAVLTLLLESLELRIFSDLEFLARSGLAECAGALVGRRGLIEDGERRRHCLLKTLGLVQYVFQLKDVYRRGWKRSQ